MLLGGSGGQAWGAGRDLSPAGSPQSPHAALPSQNQGETLPKTLLAGLTQGAQGAVATGGGSGARALNGSGCHQPCPRGFGAWVDLSCKERVSNGARRKPAGLRGASSRGSRVTPLGGGSGPDGSAGNCERGLWGRSDEGRNFLLLLGSTGGWDTPHTAADGARARGGHSLGLLPAGWARCLLSLHTYRCCVRTATHCRSVSTTLCDSSAMPRCAHALQESTLAQTELPPFVPTP